MFLKKKQHPTAFIFTVPNGAIQKIHFLFLSLSLRTEFWFTFAVFHFLAFVVHFFILPESQVAFLN